MKKILCLFVFCGIIFCGLASAASELAKHDANRVTTIIAVADGTGEIRNVRVNSDGYLILTGTLSASIVFPTDYFKAGELIGNSSFTVVLGRVNNMITTGVDVSTLSATSISARIGRRKIMVQASIGNSGKVFIRESNSAIIANGTELSAGQSWWDENYTGAVYLQASGAGSQNVRIQEIYK